jgi:hypothetical protein
MKNPNTNRMAKGIFLNLIGVLAFLGFSAFESHAQGRKMDCDSTCITPQLNLHDKVNTSTTTVNAGAISWKGQCGTANGKTYSSPPNNSTNASNFFCSSGQASSVTTGITTYDWTCTGSDSSIAYCSGNRPYVPPPPPPPYVEPTCQFSFSGTPLPPCPYTSPPPLECSIRGYTILWYNGMCG